MHVIGILAMEGQLTQQKLQVFIKFFDKYQDESISAEQRANIATYLKNWA